MALTDGQKDVLRDDFRWPQSVLDSAADEVLDAVWALIADPNRSPNFFSVLEPILGLRVPSAGSSQEAYVADLLSGSPSYIPQSATVSAFARGLRTDRTTLVAALGWESALA